jgi:hypothetical protein
VSIEEIEYQVNGFAAMQRVHSSGRSGLHACPMLIITSMQQLAREQDDKNKKKAF